ncbi:MAG: polyphenol oxidase family protein [Acidimicrobiia bacterium]
MIRPDGFDGAAFGDAGDGDARNNAAARFAMSEALGISSDWAFVSQVHGSVAVEALVAGDLGEADAIYSGHAGLPMTVATADCVPIVVEGPAIAGVIHAGWRGLDAGVIPSTLGAIAAHGDEVTRAAIGPAIGPCCYEVGQDVAGRFDGFVGTTKEGAVSVDLAAVAAHQLGDLATWSADACTSCGEGFNSFRRNETIDRQVAVAWLPPR